MSLMGARKDSREDVAAQLGYVTMLLSEIGPRADRPVAGILPLAAMAIQLRQIKIYYGVDGRPLAYVSWARLSPDVEARILRSKSMRLHPSEWNEGDSLWIVDFVAPYGDAAHVMCDLRDGPLREYPTARYMQLKRNKVLVKEIARQSTASFFTHKTVPALCGPVVLPGWREDVSAPRTASPFVDSTLS